MGILDRLFRRRPRTRVPREHAEPVDPFYADISVEDIGVYQRYFHKIIGHVDVGNYTDWSMSCEYGRLRMDADDEWMDDVIREANRDGISGALLQNMVNQYFFADILEREQDKQHWVRRVMHPRPPQEYFPPGAQMRGMMEMVSE